MRQLRITLEYDGTDLSGWQRQANAPTVQGYVEAALEQLLGHPVRLSGASRTDGGVHARGQVAAFSTDRPIPDEGMRRALNALLPPQIAANALSEVEPSFHPRFSATGKHYRYLILARRDRSPRWLRRSWHRSRPLNVEAMQEAAKYLVGEHDFAAFRAVGCVSRTTVRLIRSVEVTWQEPGLLLAIDVRGNAFLRNMVRIMAGTLADVGESRFTPAQVAEILASKDRTKGGQTAPPHGLELMEVFFEGRRVGTRSPPGVPPPADELAAQAAEDAGERDPNHDDEGCEDDDEDD
jgi:tRNA pseudouridine38-40 synthase